MKLHKMFGKETGWIQLIENYDFQTLAVDVW